MAELNIQASPGSFAESLSPLLPMTEDALLIVPPIRPNSEVQADFKSAWQGCLAHQTQEKAPKKIIFLSDAAVYGEGPFHCGDCGPIPAVNRPPENLGKFRWELLCPICGEMLMPEPIAETHTPQPISAWGKALLQYEQNLAQEAQEKTIPLVILRIFHPIWPEFLPQDEGMVFKWSRQLLADTSPNIFEDGNSIRTITLLPDIIQAIEKAVQWQQPGISIFNIAGKNPKNTFEIVAALQENLGKTDVPYIITETYCPGDTRHQIADIRKAQAELGFQPQYDTVKTIQSFCQFLNHFEKGSLRR